MMTDIFSEAQTCSPPRFNFLRIIGNGCFGYVFQVQDEERNQKFALKRIQKVGNQLSRELQILKMISKQENVIHLESIFYSKSENKLVQNLVFDFVEDNLENVIEKASRQLIKLTELDIKRYMYQLLNGLKNIHSLNIAHRDLKPENVLISKDGVIKICDFGSSKVMDKTGKNTPYMVSRYYRAPQLIMCITKYTEAIDIWAAGCILIELFTYDPIFKGKNEGDQLFSIFQVMGSMTKEDKKFYKSRVPFNGEIIDKMKQFDGIDLKSKFKNSKDKTNLIDLIRNMLCYNFENRLTAKEAMKHKYFDDVRKEFTKPVKTK